MSGLPVLGASVLKQLGVELPAMATIEVALTKGASKFHVPRADLRRSYNECQHAKEAKDAGLRANIKT